MNQHVMKSGTPSDGSDKRNLSQFVFVVIGLGIIGGGLWTLYMGDAPYHPEDQVTRSSVFLASE